MSCKFKQISEHGAHLDVYAALLRSRADKYHTAEVTSTNSARRDGERQAWLCCTIQPEAAQRTHVFRHAELSHTSRLAHSSTKLPC
jgi:hypothetical protein